MEISARAAKLLSAQNVKEPRVQGVILSLGQPVALHAQQLLQAAQQLPCSESMPAQSPRANISPLYQGNAMMWQRPHLYRAAPHSMAVHPQQVLQATQQPPCACVGFRHVC